MSQDGESGLTGLTDAARRFVKLMDNPEPGLFTWCAAKEQAIKGLWEAMDDALASDIEKEETAEVQRILATELERAADLAEAKGATCRCEAAKRTSWLSNQAKKDDVVQITGNGPWPYAFAVVAEVKPWGVLADMIVPQRGEPGRAPVRLAWDAFEIVGPAVFVADENGGAT